MATTADDQISERDYQRVRTVLYRQAGIHLSGDKRPLVAGRLQRRLRAVDAPSFAAYIDFILDPANPAELRIAIDLLTTNETYFWREPAHFAQLERLAREQAARGRPLRVWSAACSSGEEVYSIAMVLQAVCDGGLPLRWELLGSDLSLRMLERARSGHYPLERARELPVELLRRYCLRGTGEQEGSLLVARSLRERVGFAAINLIERLPENGAFDVVFLRNVMIYFDQETKLRVVQALIHKIAIGGVLFIGLAESLSGMLPGLEPIAPGMLRRTA